MIAGLLIQFGETGPDIFGPHPENVSKSGNAGPNKYLSFCIFCADICSPQTRQVVFIASPRMLFRQERMELHSSSLVDMVEENFPWQPVQLE